MIKTVVNRFRMSFAARRAAYTANLGSERGIVKPIVSMLVGVVVIGAIVVALWDTVVGTGTDVAALTGTDSGTVMLQDMWPILLTILGLLVGIGVVMWALKKLGLLSF